MDEHGSTLALRTGEFVSLAACMMALFALSIDFVLPGLAALGEELGVEQPNDRQLVIYVLILGMGLGQVVYGPISDSTGRKPGIALGLSIFIVGTITCMLAPSFRLLLVGRFLQGIGAAGPRIVTVALVRDQYAGAAMARIMSVVVAVLMVGPLIAPALGQFVMLVAAWRNLFLIFLVFAVMLLTWFMARQPETLPPESRIAFSWRPIFAAVRETCASRVALGYTLAAGVSFGAVFGWVSSAQQILQDQYGVGVRFPVYFTMTAVAVGAAALINARLVTRLGMRRLCYLAIVTKLIIAITFLASAHFYAGHPPLGMAIGFVTAYFFCLGILFGNFNALALEPLGHIAGVAAGVVGSLTWLLATMFGAIIGQLYDGTVLPLATGFVILGVTSLGLMHWVE